MIFTQLRKVLATVLLLFTASSLFAVEEYVSKIYKDIDVIFIEKSDEKLNDILSENREDKNYYLIENYAEKKIRRLIVVNDYQFAMDAIVVVIENNLDNEGAVEMYSIIAEAYETQQEYEQKQEEAKQKELARIQGEKEKKRSEVEKEYQSSKTAEGGSVYVAGKEAGKSNYECDFSFGMVNISLLNEMYKSYMATNFGLSANLNYVYSTEKVSVGADAYGDIHFLPLGSDEKIPLITNVDFAFKIASKQVASKIFARAGISLFSTAFGDERVKTSNIAESMFSPIVGLEVNKVQLGGMKFSMNADYLLGSIWTPGYKAAAQGMLDFSIPYAQLEKVNMNFHFGVKDTFLMKNEGIENRASIILAIGAENGNR